MPHTARRLSRSGLKTAANESLQTATTQLGTLLGLQPVQWLIKKRLTVRATRQPGLPMASGYRDFNLLAGCDQE